VVPSKIAPQSAPPAAAINPLTGYDAVLEDVAAWRTRPLGAVYPIAYDLRRRGVQVSCRLRPRPHEPILLSKTRSRIPQPPRCERRKSPGEPSQVAGEAGERVGVA